MCLAEAFVIMKSKDKKYITCHMAVLAKHNFLF